MIAASSAADRSVLRLVPPGAWPHRARYRHIDDTFDIAHGGQQLRLFNAYHDEYGFQPIVVFDGDGRIVTAILRPGKRPTGTEIRAHLRRIVRAIRANWPRVAILIRADGHYATPEVLSRASDRA